mmetsp:Transcript_87441/g.283105  ORF Transcript_87441/g.283105 Transcript_87441/m.283105 type:complete len:122 (-) Transcript_87441:286-651(-)
MVDQMDKQFLYAASGVYAFCAALCFSKPEDLAAETFGESAKKNEHAIAMYGPLGALMTISSITSLALARGQDAATSVMLGFSLVPFRMAVDVFKGMPPPKVMMGLGGALTAFGLYNSIRKK